jgi:hypothetical protein
LSWFLDLIYVQRRLPGIVLAKPDRCSQFAALEDVPSLLLSQHAAPAGMICSENTVKTATWRFMFFGSACDHALAV